MGGEGAVPRAHFWHNMSKGFGEGMSDCTGEVGLEQVTESR